MSVADFGARSITDILGDALLHLRNLIKSEQALARAEIAENMQRGVIAIALMGGAFLLLLPAVLVLLFAAVAVLAAQGVALYQAALVIGGGVFLLGLVLLVIGIRLIKRVGFVPTRAIRNLRQAAESWRAP